MSSGMVTGHWSLVTGHWSLGISYYSLFTVHRSLFTGLWLVACSLFLAFLYAGLIGFFTFGWYRKKKLAVGSRQSSVVSCQLSVSIIVPARNEEKHIVELLNDLSVQDYPKDLTEIIVIDDHSNDGTYGLVREFAARNKSLKFILLKTEDVNVSGKKAAISLGIKHASGEIILTTDADCRIGKGWISSLVNTFKDEKIKMVFGPVSYFEGNGFWDDFQSMEFAGLVASGAGAALAGHPFMCNGANLAYTKEAFLKISGYEGNEEYLSGDDVFLLHKMKREFGRRSVVFCKDENTLVKTYPAAGFGKFLNQRIRWASKSKGYHDNLSIITALLVFSYSLIVLTSFIAGFFNHHYFFIPVGLLVWKMIADFPLMTGITGFTGHRKSLVSYPVFQLIYPFYIVIAGFISFFGRKSW